MPFTLKGFSIRSTVVFICLFVKYGNFQIQTIKSNLSEVSGTGLDIPRFPDTKQYNSFTSDKTNVYPEENLKNFSSSNISSSSSLNMPIHQEVHQTTVVNKEFALEGGGIGIPSPNSSVKGQDDGVFDEYHNKNSKGRKGVKFPVSSPRKGVSAAVEQLGEQSNNTTPEGTFTTNSLSVTKNNTIKSSKDSKTLLPIDSEVTKHQAAQVHMKDTNRPIIGTSNTNHSKKPEYVSDAKDVDDFDKYSIIKTSTTGEDYVIIGIVIVIGIWFSVFGALIFYRRAGEYWDRRHYRRMDFLVEGMYND